MEGNHIITDTEQNGVSISYLTCMLLPPLGYVLVCIRLPVCLSVFVLIQKGINRLSSEGSEKRRSD